MRALCKALGQDWDTVYVGLSVYGFSLSDMPSANRVWGAYLRENGFRRYIVDDHGQHVYTVDDFCRDHRRDVCARDRRACCVRQGWALLGHMGQRTGDPDILLGAIDRRYGNDTGYTS